MEAFAAAILAFPTVVFTILLGVVLLYWLTVIAGIFNLDALDSVGGAVDAKAGMLDGAAEAIEAKAGMLDGAAEAIEAKAGMLDGAAEAIEAKAGVFDAAADGLEAKVGAAEAASMAAGKGRVPVTLRFSLFVLGGWVTSYLVVHNLTAAPGDASAGVIVGATAAAIVGGWLLVRVGAIPLAPLFQVTHAPKNRGLIGKVCIITTGRVDEHFGQASIEDGGAGLLIQVRCEPGLLSRNDEAVVVGWDEVEYAFAVTPLEALMR